jgi:membrane-bound metal-dependent hydrolase YbcI (DUF457 family)
MATPLGHVLAGYAVSGFAGGTRHREHVYLTLACVFAAVAPDLDVVPGLLVGQPVLFHGDLMHSAGFGLLICLIISVAFYKRGHTFSQVFALCAIAYGSHLLLDILGPDKRPPYGIPVLWPLSTTPFLSPVPILMGMHHAGSTSASTLEFVKGVLDVYNLAAIAVEIMLIAPFILLGRWYKRAYLSSEKINQ